MNHRRVFLTSALIFIVTLAAAGHDTWLMPRRTFVKRHSKMLLDLTSGMSFPLLDTSIKKDRIDVARCQFKGKVDDIASRMSAPNSLLLEESFNEAGIATCWVELKPRQLELTEKQVEEYFEEIDASPSVRQSWANMKAPKRWREIYVKHAKTFSYIGDTEKDQSWSEPVGMSLEIVPGKNPATIKPGAEFPVKILKDGAPLANFPVSIVLGGDPHREFQATDSEGIATFKIMSAGKYLLRGTNLRPSTKPDLEWESDFTTLTIQVRK